MKLMKYICPIVGVLYQHLFVVFVRQSIVFSEGKPDPRMEGKAKQLYTCEESSHQISPDLKEKAGLVSAQTTISQISKYK